MELDRQPTEMGNMTTNEQRVIEILVVEDNPGDVELIRRTFAAMDIPNHVAVVSDGREALEYLQKVITEGRQPLPNLVLLDLNLPKLDGREVLEAIKGNPDLRHIPIAVFTSSQSEKDIANAHQAGANCYIVKSIDLNEFQESLWQLVKSWNAIWSVRPS